MADPHEGDILGIRVGPPERARPIVNELPYFRRCPPPRAPARRSAARRWSANDTHLKRVVFSREDPGQDRVRRSPELTFALPPPSPPPPAWTRFTHNIESYLSPAYHPLCDGIALEGTRIGAPR